MLRVRVGIACAGVALLGTTVAAGRTHVSSGPVITHEVIAVYFGTEGTDARPGMADGNWTNHPWSGSSVEA
jgi:hypothetical protein